LKGPIVLASRLPGEKPLQSKKFRVVDLECVDDLDYWGGFAALWDEDVTIVNVEHDNECSDKLIQQLLDCPHPLCGYVYRLKGADDAPYSYRQGPLPPAGGILDWWLKGPDEEWATFGGIGFCKITPEARVRPLESRDWHTLDIMVTKAVEGPEVVPDGRNEGRRWHVHWNGGQGIDHSRQDGDRVRRPI
jgi:hypothetical protein